MVPKLSNSHFFMVFWSLLEKVFLTIIFSISETFENFHHFTKLFMDFV